MRILVIGGTSFVGRHTVEAALARGHDVTLFNRGRTNPDLFPEAERLVGDRDGGLAVLAGRSWDAVVDTCGYVPRVVADSARALAGSVGRYLFVSTLSVYPDDVAPGATEDTPRLGPAHPDVEEITDETYGPLKVSCEREVVAAFPRAATIVRPGLVVGPHDPTDRFTYWVRRVDEGGAVLAPAPPEDPVQFVDARDLAAFALLLLERSTDGVFNAVAQPVALGDLLEAIRRASGSDADVVWAPPAVLRERDVEPWSDLPLWLPDDPGMDRFDNGRAVAAGLLPRPVEDTVRDTLEWDRSRHRGAPLRAGLGRDRERDVLAAVAAAAG